MDAGDLRMFEAVARLGTMNRAAEELHTVQSNVSARIRLLEETLGAVLFVRHARGVALTDAGQRLLPYAKEVGRLMAEARRAVEDDGSVRGPLVIGSLETTAAIRLSPLLSAYAGRYPDVDLVLRTGTTAELVEEVLARRVDGAFVSGPVEHPDLAGETLFREELAVLTATGIGSLAAIFGRRDLKIVVLRAGCAYRQKLEDVLARRGIVGLRRLEFGTLEAIMGCVSAGLGITLLPRALVGPVWTRAVAIHDLPPSEAMVETVFIRRRDAFTPRALDVFLGHVRAAQVHAMAAE